MNTTRRFIAIRDRLLQYRDDLAAARSTFTWPRFEKFNWALDYFDKIAADNERPALRVVDDTGGDESLSFSKLADRSDQVARWLTELGVNRGDRILIMLANVVPLWEMMLAAIKIGAVIIPATTLLEHTDLADRVSRGSVRLIVTHSPLIERFKDTARVPLRIAVGEAVTGWVSYAESQKSRHRFSPVGHTRADDPLFLYFTSGTTARPKLVVHTHVSYPIGHLSTMYWLGLQPGDVHLNLSSPGWAKHAWSSFFAPWNAEACVLAYHYERFDSCALLDHLVHCGVSSFCAPPTVWRMLIQQDLRQWPVALREAASAGEPLNPEVIDRVRKTWGPTIRDGYGQTETSAQIGNPPGQLVKPGSMGRPLPGYGIVLRNVNGRISDEGEICIDLGRRPIGLMRGYLDDPEQNARVTSDGYYHTGDIASRDSDGYLTYIGRMDDVFKSSDYRISPFELESMLLEHPAVVEAAVVPSPDPLRLCVPKAFVTLAAGYDTNADTARALFQYARSRMSPYKRIRRLEFRILPKTISGKIRRLELRKLEESRAPDSARNINEYWEKDFPDLTPR